MNIIDNIKFYSYYIFTTRFYICKYNRIKNYISKNNYYNINPYKWIDMYICKKKHIKNIANRKKTLINNFINILYKWTNGDYRDSRDYRRIIFLNNDYITVNKNLYNVILGLDIHITYKDFYNIINQYIKIDCRDNDII